MDIVHERRCEGHIIHCSIYAICAIICAILNATMLSTTLTVFLIVVHGSHRTLIDR
jgi:hypothetical protein